MKNNLIKIVMPAEGPAARTAPLVFKQLEWERSTGRLKATEGLVLTNKHFDSYLEAVEHCATVTKPGQAVAVQYNAGEGDNWLIAGIEREEK